MRLIVVGDIHGNNEKFRRALKSVSLKKGDKLILLGDTIDRGTQTKDVLDTIFLLKDNGFNNIIYLRGNHEQMLIDSYEDENKEYIWLKNGGDKTLRSFKVNFCNQIPDKYIELIKSSIFYYEYEDYLFVHAGLNFQVEEPLKDIHSLLWTREIDEIELSNSIYSNKTIIHGHTPQPKEEIKLAFNNSKSIINLDNGVYLNKEDYGSLAIADLTNQKINFV